MYVWGYRLGVPSPDAFLAGTWVKEFPDQIGASISGSHLSWLLIPVVGLAFNVHHF